MPPRVFIDGHMGTTGLRIRDWLARRDDLDVVELPESQRKVASARRDALAAADLAVLCLPDDAAREAVALAEGTRVRILDASAAHRVSKGWVFGLPELAPEQRGLIANATRVSNPGCYSSAVIVLLRPLVDAGLVPRDAPIAIHALSGYSGGGREMISKWEDPSGGMLTQVFEAPYALDRVHKHAPEMTRWSGLTHEPQFTPAVGPFRCGMRVQVPIPASLLPRGASGKSIWEALDARYRGEAFVRVLPIVEPLGGDERSFDPRACNDTNRIELRVLPHPSGHVLLMAVLDNLGKGASGVAIQNLNLMLGLPEARGLPA